MQQLFPLPCIDAIYKGTCVTDNNTFWKVSGFLYSKTRDDFASFLLIHADQLGWVVQKIVKSNDFSLFLLKKNHLITYVIITDKSDSITFEITIFL